MKKAPALLLGTLLLFSVKLYCQSDSLQAEQYITLAKACVKNGHLDSVELYQSQAQRYFRSKDLLAPWLRSFTALAYPIAGTLRRPYPALELVEKALNNKWRNPKNSNEWEQLAMTYLAAGHILRVYPGDFNGAKRYFESAEEIFRVQLKEQSHRLAVYLYHNLANIYTRHGDYERSISLLRRSLNYHRLHPDAKVFDHGDLAIALQETGQYQEAMEILTQGFAIENSSSEIKITLYLNLASLNLHTNHPQQASQDLEKIPVLITKMVTEKGSLDEWYYQMQYHSSKAEILEALGNNRLAEQNYLSAIQAGIKHWGTEKRREVGKVYGNLGALKMKEKKFLEALKYYHHSLQCVVKGLESGDINQMPAHSAIFPENTILEALEGKARAFRALGQLDKALECYELIPVVETKLRATHAYESSSLLALEESRLRFDQAVEIAWQLYAQTSLIGYAERAFRLTEQARGMLLLQSLSEAQASYKLPENIRRQEEKLNGKLVWYDREIAAERDAGAQGDAVRLAQLEKEQFDLKQENEKFKAELRRNFPEYAALSDEIRFLQVADVPKLLRNNQAFLDFYLTENHVFVFAIDNRGNFSWRRAELPNAFRENVKRWVDYLQKGDEDDQEGAVFFRRQAHELFALLLAPELQKMLPQSGSIMLVPDDALVFVPFEVLLMQPAPTGNWRDLPWLLGAYSTGYAYSATLLQMQHTISRQHREQTARPKYPFGGFSAQYDAADIYQPVGTEPLVRNTRKLLGGKIWHNHRCNEETFKKMAPDCRVLLLAMHGKADAENPALSQFLFGNPGPDSLENNNKLFAGELQIMRLQADLAVLSACYSGFGKLHHGEGVFSLARAFARSGVPATVMSLWLLQDNTPGPLLESFFQYLQAGKSKDEALRLAKLDFIKNDEHFAFSHPTYWACLTATGDMCELELPPPASFPWWWPAGILLLLLGAFFAWRYRQRR